jgi:DNA-binding response OmpR family regulator
MMPEDQILIVDDDPTILAAVADLLDLEGFPVATATNGAEALRSLGQAIPSVVLLDMRMPILDGWEFAREARAAGHQLRIIVMTAAHDARRWAEEIGAAGHVSKPFEMDDLLAELRRVLNTSI